MRHRSRGMESPAAWTAPRASAISSLCALSWISWFRSEGYGDGCGFGICFTPSTAGTGLLRRFAGPGGGAAVIVLFSVACTGVRGDAAGFAVPGVDAFPDGDAGDDKCRS